MRRWRRRLVLGVLLLAIAAVAGLYWLGTGGYRYSDEQQALIDQSGKPDGFVIGFSAHSESNPERFELTPKEAGRVLDGTQQTTDYTGNVGTASIRCQR